MKKAMILDLIRYHEEHNENEFRRTAYEVAKEFDKSGDYQLGEYIVGLLSKGDTLSPQSNEANLTFFTKLEVKPSVLPLPESLKEDLIGVGNAILHAAGVHTFLFEGLPGTGKTESVKQLGRILGRDIFEVDFSQIVDSRLGQTAKNIKALFSEMNSYPGTQRVIFLFDEIDSLALDRLDSHDLREMGRATSALLKGMDELREDVVLIGTTNLYQAFDKALIRRFDAVIHFDRYTREDLAAVAETLINALLPKYPEAKKDTRLLRKILSLVPQLPMPGELKNEIRTSLAFSAMGSGLDYLRRLFLAMVPGADKMSAEQLRKAGFTFREISTLTGIPRSSVARRMGE